MPRAKPDPDLVAQAFELLAGGCSNYEAAEILGVTEGTVRRWAKAAPSAPAELPAHMRPPPPVTVTELNVTDPGAMLQQLLSELHGAIQTDRAAGNMRGASSMMATLAKLATLKKQIDAAGVADSAVLKIPAHELATAEAMIDARLQALADRGPVLCAECSRALSVKWGTATDA